MPSHGIHGIATDNIAKDAELAKTLRADDMERFCVVPRTVMINSWPDDLDWLILDRTYPSQIARRHELLQTRREMTIDRLPGRDVRDAELELRDTVVAYLLKTYPRYFQRRGDLVLSPLTGLAIDIGPEGADPLVAVALLASEDVLLLLPETRAGDEAPRYVLKAGALLFPNDWSLRSHFHQPLNMGADADRQQVWQAARQKSLQSARLGKTPYAIHEGHVGHYMQHFASRVDLFFARMEPGMRTWRRNWGPRMSGELFLHSDALPAALPEFTADNWAMHGYLRSEHETFIKLPRSGAVMFGIKTYLWKLSELVNHRAALQALLSGYDKLTPTMFEYRAESLPTFGTYLQRYRD